MGLRSIFCPVEEETENGGRGYWANPMEFILSCLGYAVGLGNVWRFPYMCYENGGGAFLIPYFIMLTFVGIPVFMIELSMGQYGASGPVTVWEASPLFQGVGVGMIVISFIGNIYYNMIIAWSLYYMCASFQKTLPWDGCDHDYNTKYCFDWELEKECNTTQNGTWVNPVKGLEEDTEFLTPNISCYTPEMWVSQDNSSMRKVCNVTADVCWNETYNPFRQELNDIVAKRVFSPEEYFNIEVLDRSETIEDWGYMKWDLTLAFLGSWIICLLCMLRGIKSSGKVVYFTATFPYLVLVILFFRGVTLENALEGVKFYIIPDWEKLLTPKVWVDAAGQIFFSLSVGFGGLMTFASYNRFHNNIYRDTLVVAIGNCLTSFFAGFAIFSILGHMAGKLGVGVEDVASSGSGLAFIVYPEVFTLLPPPQLWSVLFFFMLLTLGLDSQFAGIENVVTAIVDVKPNLRKHKTLVTTIMCAAMFFLGLSQCTRAGIYWLELMSYYSSGWALVLMGTAEGIIFPWVYGGKRLMADIEHMVGFKLWWHWWVCWMIVTPILLLIILVFNFIDFTPLSYGDYLLPPWAQGVGWAMAVAAIIFIPVIAIFKICRSHSYPGYEDLHLGQRIVKLTRPTELWLPAIVKYPEQYTEDEEGKDGEKGKDGEMVKDDGGDVVKNGTGKGVDAEKGFEKDNFGYAADDRNGYNDKFAMNWCGVGGGDGDGGADFTTRL